MSVAQFVPSVTTDLRDAYRLLTPTAVKTSGYAAAAGDFVPVDTSAGAVTVTLPTAPSDKAVVCVKQTNGTKGVTIACGGTDVYNRAGGATTATLTLKAQALLVQYSSSAGIWYVVSDDLPLAQLDYNAKGYGAIGDDTANDTTAITNAWADASAAGVPIKLPPGTYSMPSTARSAQTVSTYGRGQIHDASGKAAPIFNQLTAQPSSLLLGPSGFTTNAFGGDISKVPFPVEHRVLGRDTLGTVAQTTGVAISGTNTYSVGNKTINVTLPSGYVSLADCGFPASGTAYMISASTGAATAFTYGSLGTSAFLLTSNYGEADAPDTIRTNTSVYFEVQEASPFVGYLYSESGRNGAASVGRTGLGFFHIKLQQTPSSGGDMVALFVDGANQGYNASATRWDQLPSVGMWAGGGTIQATGVYVDPDELQIQDDSRHEGTAIGLVRNMGRHLDDLTDGLAPNGSQTWNAGTNTVLNVTLPSNVASLATFGFPTSGGTAYLLSSGGTVTSFTYTTITTSQFQGCSNYGTIDTTYLVRTNGKLGTFWQGIRIDSVGTVPLDAGIQLNGNSLGGGYRVGIDLANAQLTTTGTYQYAAITMSVNQKIYWNATPTADAASAGSSGIGFYNKPSAIGAVWDDYVTTSGGMRRIIVGGNTTLQVTASQVTANGAFLTTGTSHLTGAVTMDGAASVGGSLTLAADPQALIFSALSNTWIDAHASSSAMRFVVGNSTLFQMASTGLVASVGLNMNTHAITNVVDGSAAQDATTVAQRVDPLAQAAGYVQWNFNPMVGTNTSPLTAGTVYATAIYIPPGKTIANVVLTPTVAAAGTNPTSFFVGIAGPTGTMLAQSNDVKATVIGGGSNNLPTALPLNASYTTSASDSATGLYYIVALQVGSWGSTQPSFLRMSGSASAGAPLGANPRLFATGVTTSRTTLPANGSGIAGGLTTASAVGLFAGVS